MDLFSLSNHNAFSLTKASSSDDLKRYFAAVLEISRSGNEFPIDLDEVWMLAYPRKDHAVRALTENFMQDVDYQVFPKNGENKNSQETRGRKADVYKLSVSCMEFFVARKVRPVFEVYRQVFHGMANTYQVPQSFSEALMLAAKQQETIEEQQKQIAAARPAITFTQAVSGSASSCLIGELAKLIDQNGYPMGEKRLFKWMRDNGYLGTKGERYNIPNQRYIEMGLFELKKGVRSGSGGVLHTTITTKVLGKGQVYFVNKFNDMKRKETA
jgi:phage antirepressor YoqD-like protein